MRVAYTDEREIQHALDGGAMVLVVPTVDTEEEAKQVVQWAYYQPLGRRSQGATPDRLRTESMDSRRSYYRL